MEPQLLEKQNTMLRYVSQIPKKMLLLHGKDNVTEFVLHDLCHEHCFDIHRAAYFIDNPDFNFLRGIAGFSRDEAYAKCDAIWHEPEAFSQHMLNSFLIKKFVVLPM